MPTNLLLQRRAYGLEPVHLRGDLARLGLQLLLQLLVQPRALNLRRLQLLERRVRSLGLREVLGGCGERLFVAAKTRVGLLELDLEALKPLPVLAEAQLCLAGRRARLGLPEKSTRTALRALLSCAKWGPGMRGAPDLPF